MNQLYQQIGAHWHLTLMHFWHITNQLGSFHAVNINGIIYKYPLDYER